MAIKQKGLGRGLDAIFSVEKINPTQQPMSEMAQIDINRIVPNPTQPRTQFDQAAIDELSASIAALGVIQPITVKATDEGKYIIISGERRWRASQSAGLESIPAYVREATDEELHTMALVENIQRQDLNAIEIALGMQRLVDECSITQDALSDKIGKPRSTVSNYLRLLKLSPEIQLAIKEGYISMGHAKAIAGAEPEHQVAVLKKCVKKSLSVRQVEDLVRLMNEKQPKTAVSDEEYPESYTKLVEKLEQLFTQDISIKRAKSGGGKIVIGFNSDEDIDNFLRHFKQ